MVLNISTSDMILDIIKVLLITAIGFLAILGISSLF